MPTLEARPTIYKGIRMRSRLEALYAAILDDLGSQWEYEPCCFADETGQYLPDFRTTQPDGTRTYVEVKGPPVLHPEPILRRMSIIWSSEPTARLRLVDYGRSIDWEGWQIPINGHHIWRERLADDSSNIVFFVVDGEWRPTKDTVAL